MLATTGSFLFAVFLLKRKTSVMLATLPGTSSFQVLVIAFVHCWKPFQPLERTLRAERHHWNLYGNKTISSQIPMKWKIHLEILSRTNFYVCNINLTFQHQKNKYHCSLGPAHGSVWVDEDYWQSTNARKITISGQHKTIKP